MKFLCLPGAFGSAKNFAVQLGPFAKAIEDRGLATFVYTQGHHEVDPPLGWENYFGSRPLYRFVDPSEGDAFEVLRRVRHIPRGLGPEATLRLFESKGSANMGFSSKSLQAAINAVLATLQEDPEIDGIIGYSEGAMIAACVLLEEERRWQEKGIPPQLKFGIFFSGAPPAAVEEDGKVEMKLADKVQSVINVPTFHILGSDDPLCYSAVALYNVCNQENAMLYDHGLGHLVPRDQDNLSELGTILDDVITKINKSKTAGWGTPGSSYTVYSEDSALAAAAVEACR